MERDKEQRLADLEARVARLEVRFDRGLERAGTPDGPPEEPDLGATPASRGAEYWIGAKFLPRFGAVLIVLAIAFVAISESSKNPSLDRMVLLGGEALFCFAFIAFGEWRRDELEGFGPTLSAIGSTGLYLTAAGGHFAYAQLSAAGMAVGFALLTLLNHAFAVWRNTRLFFFIGASGGLAAMLFPLADKDYSTALAVYVAVTVAGAVVCARRRWSQLALVGWFFSLVIIVPIIDSDQSRATVLAAMYAGSLACIAAYARACSGRDLDTLAPGAPIALFVTGLMGFWVQHGPVGVIHLLVLAAAGLLIAAVFSGPKQCRNALVVGSVAALAGLGPLCFPPMVATIVYSALVVAAFVVGRFALRHVVAVFAVAGLLAAGLAYARFMGTTAGVEEGASLASLAVALACATLALRGAGWGWVGFVAGGVWLLLIRTSLMISATQTSGLASYSNLTIASLAYALLLLSLGFRLDSPNLRMWSFAVMLGSVMQILFVDAGTAVGFRIASLVAVGVMMLVGGYRYVHDQRSPAGSEAAERKGPS